MAVASASRRRQSHSIAAALWNLGLEYRSFRWKFVSTNLAFWSKLRIVVDPDSDSAKCCMIGALHTPTSLASSRAVEM